MNKSNNGSRYGITQYRSPLDFELAGKTFTLSGGGQNVTLTFRDGQFLTCAAGGDELCSAYEALKVADGAHLVLFGTKDLRIAAIDTVGGTAAVSFGEPGSYEFFQIDGVGHAGAGAELPGFTDEMTGTYIRWVPAFEKYLELRFTAPDACEITFSPRKDRPRSAPAACIRIREGLYLTEVNRTSPMWSDMPQGYSRIVLLQDYKRLLFVGGIYSPVLNDLKLLSGYGADPEPEG